MEAYRNLIYYFAEKNQYGVLFDVYESGTEALFSTEDGMGDPDIILIGWEYNDVQGIKIAEILREQDCDAEIIFFESGTESENMLSSFEVNPFYYFNEEGITHGKLEKVLIRCFDHIREKRKSSLNFIQYGRKRKVALNQIVYLRIEHRVIEICCANGKRISFYASLKNVEEMIQNDNFVRIHRGYIVNLHYVNSIDKAELILSTGETLPIARNCKQNVVEHMLQLDRLSPL